MDEIHQQRGIDSISTCRMERFCGNSTSFEVQASPCTWRSCQIGLRCVNNSFPIYGWTYSGPHKSWPVLQCISYGRRGHDFCGPLYTSTCDSGSEPLRVLGQTLVVFQVGSSTNPVIQWAVGADLYLQGWFFEALLICIEARDTRFLIWTPNHPAMPFANRRKYFRGFS